MKRIILSVATLTLAIAAVALGESPKARQTGIPHWQAFLIEDQSQARPELKTFIGTIAKSGEQFVLKEDSGETAYRLDDQQSAGKFAGKRVRVTGVLDASNNTIRVQSIEEANA
jgi:hypothetical protein